MFFFFKKPTVTIDAFVPDNYAFALEYAPIQKASKFLPEWFKNLPSLNKNIDKVKKNVKGCPGFISSLTDGFIVPMWCDLRLEWNQEDFYYAFSDRLSAIKFHSNEQASGFLDNYWILKVESPWLFSFSKHTKINQLPLTYFLGLDYPIKTLHGSQFTRSKFNALFSNNFFIIKKSEPEKITFKFNTPFVHFTLSSEQNYKLNCHIDTKKYNLIANTIKTQISFVRNSLWQTIMDKKNIKK